MHDSIHNLWLLQDDFDKGTFHFLELYSAQRCMTDHNNSPEIKKFVDQVGESGCKGR